MGIDVDESSLFVVNQLKHVVEVFDLEGKHVMTIGSGFGDKEDELNGPQGICLSQDGNLFVADTFNNVVFSFFSFLCLYLCLHFIIIISVFKSSKKRLVGTLGACTISNTSESSPHGTLPLAQENCSLQTIL